MKPTAWSIQLTSGLDNANSNDEKPNGEHSIEKEGSGCDRQNRVENRKDNTTGNRGDEQYCAIKTIVSICFPVLQTNIQAGIKY